MIPNSWWADSYKRGMRFHLLHLTMEFIQQVVIIYSCW